MSVFAKPKNPDNVIAFDYGTSRIGVAVGNRVLGTSQGVDIVTVHGGKADENKISELVNTWQPGQIIVGLPDIQSEHDTPLQKEITRFANRLGKRFDLPVSFVNERLSSEESTHRINSIGKRFARNKKTELRNMIAAEIILETYFSSLDEMN